MNINIAEKERFQFLHGMIATIKQSIYIYITMDNIEKKKQFNLIKESNIIFMVQSVIFKNYIK